MEPLRSLFEATAEALVLVDGERVIANPAARAELGADRDLVVDFGDDVARARLPDGSSRRLQLVARGGPCSLWMLALESEPERSSGQADIFRQITEHIREVIWLRDLQPPRMLYVNRAYEEVWGRSREELLEDPAAFMQSVYEDDREHVRAAYERQRRGLEFFDEEYRIVTPCGDVRWVWARNFPIRDATGHVFRVAGIADDVTEQKEHEAELERRIAERAERIRELEHQRAETERLAANARMAARIAHEINNPIAGIRNCLQLLRYERPDDQEDAGMDYLALAEQEIVRVSRIVHQLLDLHRPDPHQTHDVRPSELLDGMRVLLEPSARHAEVSLDVEVGGTDEPVRLNRGLLRQILYNLAQNAIEASPPGAEVRIEAEVAEHEVRFRVRDRGRGIPPELHERIFEPLHTTKHGSGGLGLGLSVSKRAAEAMGGTLRVDSEAGRGSVFTVHLPRP